MPYAHALRASLLLSAAVLAAPGSVRADALPGSGTTDPGPQPDPSGLRWREAGSYRWGGGQVLIGRATWRGLPVRGARRTTFVAPDGLVLRTVGGDPFVLPFTDVPTLGGDDAARRATEFVAEEGLRPSSRPTRTTLIVFVRGGVASLTWSVDLFSEAPFAGHRVLVDATTGAVLLDEPTTFTARASIYPTNPEASDVEDVDLDVDDDVLINDYATVSSCADFDDEQWICEEKERQATADADGNFFFAPAPLADVDPFAEVQMFHHIDVVSRWFEAEFGFRADYGVGDDRVEGIVNFPLANAFFGDADADGKPEIAFGQGGGVDFAYDADVIYHEFGHGVFGQVVESNGGRYDNYGRLVAPQGLNEGTADLLSMTLTVDPLLGEYAGSGPLGGGAIRDLGPDRRCPDAVYGESHKDGEMWAALGWNLIEDPAVGPLVTAHLVMGALARWPVEGVDWTIAGNSLLETADDLAATAYIDADQRAAIERIVGAAGFVDCTRWVPLDEGAEPTQILSARIGNDGTPRTPPLPNPFSLDAPEGTTELRFYVEELETGGADMGFRVYVRRGEPVWFELEELGNGRVTAVPAEYDAVFEGDDEGKVVELNAESDPPLEPGATYHFAVTAAIDDDFDGWGFGEITVGGSIDWTAPEPPAAVDDGQGDGCSDCGGSGTAAMVVVAFPLVVGRRRRASR